MAASWFSHKKSASPAPEGSSLGAALSVRTMHDDLENIKNGRGVSGSAAQEIGAYRNTPLPGQSSMSINPFSEEGEKLLQSEDASAPNSGENPFGVAPSPPKSVGTPLPSKPVLENGLSSLVDRGTLLRSQPAQKQKAWLMLGIGAVTLLILGGAAWYFFSSSESLPEPVSPPLPIESISDMPETVLPKISPFALDKPNYLSFNTEVVSPQDIRGVLTQAADRIKESDTQGLIEFLVTDQNNNPLAFSRFAFLLKIDLDPDILALIDEKFSIYAYNDRGAVRFGLALKLKDPAAAAALIEQREAELPYAFRQFILEPDIVVARKIDFRTTGYNQFSIRFANIDSPRNLSLDYVRESDRWYMGMSKDTLRAILDSQSK